MIDDDLEDQYWKWTSGVAADGGCLCCFPFRYTRIRKYNPYDDTSVFVGEKIKGDYRFSGTIKANNGCMYGISVVASRIKTFNVAT